MSASLYKFFYRQYGVRKVTQLINPRPLKLLGLPRDSLFHYYGDTPETEAIDTTIGFLSMGNVKAIIDFTTDYSDPIKGAARKKPFIARNATRDFFKEHRNYRYLPNGYKSINNPLILFIQNHSYLNEIYKYTDLPMTNYYRWFNTYNTILNNVNRIANETNKNQFLYIDVPETLPTFPIFELYMNRESLQLLKLFDTADKYLLLELWKWLDEEYRSTSIFNVIDPNKYNQVNLIFKYKDTEVLINLGYLNSFIKKQPNTTEFANVMQFPNIYIKKLLLRFFINIKTIATLTEVEKTEVEEGAIDVDVDDPDLDNEEDAGDGNIKRLLKTNKKVNNSNEPPSDSEATIIEDDSSDEDIAETIKKIDSELETYNKFYALKLREKGISIDGKGNIQEVNYIKETIELSPEELKQAIYTAKDPETSLRDSIEAMAKDDSITISEYKKFKGYINSYNQSPSVYAPKKTNKDMIGYKDDDIKLEKSNAIADVSEVVMDKNMAGVSNRSMTKDYHDKLYHKDITNVIYNIQKANVIVKSHTLEVESSALGDYEYHRLELVPVDGAPSTVSFKIPRVNPDGSFIAGSNKCSLRAQRCDVSIRKISPTKVSLVSYYGKNFVELSRMKANSSIEHIVKNIYKQYQAKTIQNLAPGDVYDNYFKAPYIYNALSNRFKSLEKNELRLIFDREQILELVPEDQLKKLEIKGSRACGITTLGEPIVVNKDNEFYKVVNGQYVSLGDIYSVLEIDSIKAPIDFSEFRVFDKYIPVGVILGYLLGLNNILKVLDMKYFKVENKEDVTKDHFTIKFKDGLYAFDKKNTVGSKVISGLLEFEKTLKNLNLQDLNHKDTYYILFEEKKITSVYVKEIELTNELFVDPITESILKGMNEPTTFTGLLIRATEMLDDYGYPDSQDLTQMRIRGYERIAGFIYKELARSIKTFKNKNINGRSKVDLGPYDIWNAIIKDNSIKLVEDINPVQDLKERDVVTYVGEGGRDKGAIQKEARSFHDSDFGVISEATVDSSDVAVNAYMSANPNFVNLRGMVGKLENVNTPGVLSASANLAPFSVMDD